MHRTEQDFSSKVKKALRTVGAHVTAVENTAGSGVSDINVCWAGTESWVELKVVHGKKLHFRSSQRAWMTAHEAVGGKCWVLARSDDDEVALWRGPQLFTLGTVGGDEKSFAVEVRVDGSWLGLVLWSGRGRVQWLELLDVLAADL